MNNERLLLLVLALAVGAILLSLVHSLGGAR